MLLIDSDENVVFAGGKKTISKYVQYCPKTTKRAQNVRLKLQSTTTGLEIVSKKFHFMSKLAERKKCHKLIKRKYKQVTCFIRRMAKRCETIGRITTIANGITINHQKVTTSCCKCSKKISLKSTLSTIDTIRSNNGSYFSKSKKRKQQQHQQQQRHFSLQQQEQKQRLYYYNGIRKPQLQQQQQNEKIKNFQIVRLYARSGVHLRRRRKRRFFINLYTKKLQFRKLKAIKTSKTPTHNNMISLLTKNSLSSSIMSEHDIEVKTFKLTTTNKSNCESFYNNRNRIVRTTFRKQQKQKQQQQGDDEEYSFEKSKGNQILPHSTITTTATITTPYSNNGNCSWRLLFTSLIALTASTTTRLTNEAAKKTSELSATTRRTLPTLFQRQLQRCCQLNNGLNKKYSWIFLLIYLNLSAKGKR